jgi:hypothetical protein
VHAFVEESGPAPLRPQSAGSLGDTDGAGERLSGEDASVLDVDIFAEDDARVLDPSSTLNLKFSPLLLVVLSVLLILIAVCGSFDSTIVSLVPVVVTFIILVAGCFYCGAGACDCVCVYVCVCE